MIPQREYWRQGSRPCTFGVLPKDICWLWPRHEVHIDDATFAEPMCARGVSLCADIDVCLGCIRPIDRSCRALLVSHEHRNATIQSHWIVQLEFEYIQIE